MAQQTFTITDPTGLHARPTTLLISTANRFQSKMTITYNEKTVDLKSILGVMSLGILQGASIVITAEGTDEKEALAALTETIHKEHIGE